MPFDTLERLEDCQTRLAARNDSEKVTNTNIETEIKTMPRTKTHVDKDKDKNNYKGKRKYIDMNTQHLLQQIFKQGW